MHEGYTGVGRPNKIKEIDEKAWVKIIRAIGDGVPYAFVCDLAGVGLSTWNEWVKKARLDKESGITNVFTEFLYRIEAAKAAHVRDAMSDMRNAPKGHKGHEWVLSRRHAEHFHQGTKVEHSGKVDGDHTVTVFDPETLLGLGDVDDMEEEDDG